MEWITPGYDEYELSAEMTGYAGHWPAGHWPAGHWPAAEADEAVTRDESGRDEGKGE
jgi:hypothetical protein